VNRRCLGYENTSTVSEMEYCGCNIGYGGPFCNETCAKDELEYCGEPNYCYYTMGEFKCQCGPFRVGQDCKGDIRWMHVLFNALELHVVGTIIFVLWPLALALMFIAVRRDGLFAMRSSCVLLLNFALHCNVYYYVLSLVAFYKPETRAAHNFIFGIIPQTFRTFGMMILLCAHVMLIFYYLQLIVQAEENDFTKTLPKREKVVLTICLILYMAAWSAVIVLHYFGYVNKLFRWETYAFCKLCIFTRIDNFSGMLPVTVGFSVVSGRIQHILEKFPSKHNRGLIKQLKIDLVLLRINNILISSTILILLGAGFSTFILMELSAVKAEDPAIKIMDVVLTFVVNISESLVMSMMFYLLFDVGSFLRYCCCCIIAWRKRNKKNKELPPQSDTQPTEHLLADAPQEQIE
jgi:hypothetical protein